MSAFPNPFNDKISIEATYAGAGPASISVYDITGRLVIKQENLSCTSGHIYYELDAEKNGIGNGVYLLTLTAGNELIKKEIVRIK